LAQGLVMLLVRAFYAAGHTFLPVGINLISSVATIAGAFGALDWFQNSPAFRSWFLGVLKVPDFSGAGVLVLPLAVSLGSLINVFLLLIYFKRIFGSFDGGARLPDGQGLNRSLRDAALSSVILGAATYYALKLFALLFRLDTFVGIFSQGFLAGTLGILAGWFCTGSRTANFKKFPLLFAGSSGAKSPSSPPNRKNCPRSRSLNKKTLFYKAFLDFWLGILNVNLTFSVGLL